jgi:hypothetical protein
MNHLNKYQSIGVFLIVLNYGCRSLVAIYGLLFHQAISKTNGQTVFIVTTSLLLWISLAAIPILQAIRLTIAFKSLCKTGQAMIDSRKNTEVSDESNEDIIDYPESTLQSLLLFTSTIKLEPKMFVIPIRASCVTITVLIIPFILLFLGQINFLKF